MTIVIRWTRLFALAALLVLGACGGGVGGSGSGSGSGGNQYAEGGMGGSGSGTSSGYGSIIVNETRHFPIDPFADITVDGTEVAPDSVNDVDRGLPLGMTLEYVLAGDANGALTEGTAIRIRANHRAIGPVTQVEPHLEVLGQPVLVTSETRLDGLSRSEVDNLAAGDVVKVDGHVNRQGTIRATRVAQPAGAPTRWQLIGRLDAGASGGSFTIHGQTVDQGGVIPGCPLTAGQRVLVRAGAESEVGFDGTIDTTMTIRCLSESLSLYGDQAPDTLPSAVEGIITDQVVLSDGRIQLSLNGQTVIVDPANLTEILFGTVDELRLGARIEVTGTLNTTTNEVMAESIRFRDPLVTLTAPVDGGVAGELLLSLGVEIRPTPGMTDDAGLFSNPASAGQATIRGFVVDDQTVYAEEVIDAGSADAGSVALSAPIISVDNSTDLMELGDSVYDAASAEEIILVSALGDTLSNTFCSLLGLLCADQDLESAVKAGSMSLLINGTWDATASRVESGTLEITQPSQ